jgi:hypothetical protein
MQEEDLLQVQLVPAGVAVQVAEVVLEVTELLTLVEVEVGLG